MDVRPVCPQPTSEACHVCARRVASWSESSRFIVRNLWKMLSLGPKKDGGPNAKFFEAPEVLTQLDGVKQWLLKNCKKVRSFVRTWIPPGVVNSSRCLRTASLPSRYHADRNSLHRLSVSLGNKSLERKNILLSQSANISFVALTRTRESSRWLYIMKFINCLYICIYTHIHTYLYTYIW